jgi:hypothetical protein
MRASIKKLGDQEMSETPNQMRGIFRQFSGWPFVMGAVEMLAAIFLLCANPTVGAVGSQEDVKPKMIFTHVMHQMAVGAVNNPKETFLAVEPSRQNGVMALHTPETLLNYGKPMAAARHDIADMQKTGVDAMFLLLSAGQLESQFAPMIHAYYQAALQDGHIKIAPDTWTDLSKPEALSGIYGELFDKYPEVWLKRDGKLVVAVWMGHGIKKLPPYQETVDKLFSRIGGRSNVFLVLYSPAMLKNYNPEWYAGADAFTGWMEESYGTSHEDMKKLEEYVNESGKEFWCPVMPSFTQSRYPHQMGTFIPNLREKLGMTWFRYSWKKAISDNAPVVCLQTWNDLTEDSSIMPESNHGDAYFELNKYYAEWFKTGNAPKVKREQVLLFHHPQVVEGLKLPEGVKPMEGFPVAIGKDFNSLQTNRTPPTDFIGVVTMLKSPAEVSVMLGETVLGKKVMPAGLTSWLLYQPRGLNDPQKRYTCDPEKVYPKEESGFFVTVLEKPFFDAEVYVSVARDGRRPGSEEDGAGWHRFVASDARRIGFFRSHRPIAGAAGRGDMTTVGDVFRLGQ